MVFACNALPGMSLAFPDTCNTVVGPATVPLPYPNMATATTATPASANVLQTEADRLKQEVEGFLASVRQVA